MGDEASDAASSRTEDNLCYEEDQQPPPPPSASSIASKEASRENPFAQYYAQLIHQQNMLQDTVRVTAYQRAICENAADFKVIRI